jgi:periplasmic protein TonB
MFSELIESKPKVQRSPGSAAFSLFLHTLLIIGAVYATSRADEIVEAVKDEKVEFVEEVKPKDEPPPPEEKAPPPPDVAAAPPPPKGFQVLQAPVEIPDVIPKIDLNRKAIDEADFTGKGVAGGTSKGVEGAPPAPIVDANQTYFEFQVEKPVVALNNAQPNYPGMLQSQGVGGQVIAQFVVDTTGRVDVSTFKVIESSHELFTSAVKATLPRMRFQPAEVGGRKVKQLVQQPFVFNLGK